MDCSPEEEDFTDDREAGNYSSRYNRAAWIQIFFELFTLIVFTGVLGSALFL